MPRRMEAKALNRATFTVEMKVGRQARRLVILGLLLVLLFFLWPTVGLGAAIALALLAAMGHAVWSRRPLSLHHREE